MSVHSVCLVGAQLVAHIDAMALAVVENIQSFSAQRFSTGMFAYLPLARGNVWGRLGPKDQKHDPDPNLRRFCKLACAFLKVSVDSSHQGSCSVVEHGHFE